VIPAELPAEVRGKAEAIARAAKRLNDLRERWLNPPEWCDRVPEVTPLGLERSPYPDRIVAKPGHEKELAKRTLTNLYNQRPAWLAMAHEALDAAVAAAYGWTDYTPQMSDDEILARLLALNLQRAKAGDQPAPRRAKRSPEPDVPQGPLTQEVQGWDGAVIALGEGRDISFRPAAVVFDLGDAMAWVEPSYADPYGASSTALHVRSGKRIGPQQWEGKGWRLEMSAWHRDRVDSTVQESLLWWHQWLSEQGTTVQRERERIWAMVKADVLQQLKASGSARKQAAT